MDRNNDSFHCKQFHNYINAKWQLLLPCGSRLHIPPTDYHLLAAKQEPYQNAHLLTKIIEDFSEKKLVSQDNRSGRTTGVNRGTREEKIKWNQMTALRFQTRGETSDIPDLPSGEFGERKKKLR